MKHASWDFHAEYEDFLHTIGTRKCSNCQEAMPRFSSTNYCPNCGAKMDKGQRKLIDVPIKIEWHAPTNADMLRRTLKDEDLAGSICDLFAALYENLSRETVLAWLKEEAQ